MHAIGIYHEQSRADRDNFVKIHWDNIVPRFKKNFKLVSKKKGKYAFDYDYNSGKVHIKSKNQSRHVRFNLSK